LSASEIIETSRKRGGRKKVKEFPRKITLVITQARHRGGGDLRPSGVQ